MLYYTMYKIAADSKKLTDLLYLLTLGSAPIIDTTLGYMGGRHASDKGGFINAALTHGKNLALGGMVALLNKGKNSMPMGNAAALIPISSSALYDIAWHMGRKHQKPKEKIMSALRGWTGD